MNEQKNKQLNKQRNKKINQWQKGPMSRWMAEQTTNAWMDEQWPDRQGSWQMDRQTELGQVNKVKKVELKEKNW